jgi:hypothetical protein
VAAFEDLDNAAFRATILAIPLDAHDHAIAVERVGEIVRRHEDIARQAFDRPFGSDKAESRRMAVQLADDQIHSIGQAVAVALDLDERAVIDEMAKEALDACPIVARDLQVPQEFPRRGGVRHALPHEVQ